MVWNSSSIGLADLFGQRLWQRRLSYAKHPIRRYLMSDVSALGCESEDQQAGAVTLGIASSVHVASSVRDMPLDSFYLQISQCPTAGGGKRGQAMTQVSAQYPRTRLLCLTCSGRGGGDSPSEGNSVVSQALRVRLRIQCVAFYRCAADNLKRMQTRWWISPSVAIQPSLYGVTAYAIPVDERLIVGGADGSAPDVRIER
jgi:hypothetical protein